MTAIIIIICALIGAAIRGGWGFFIGLFIGWVIDQAIKSSKKNKKTRSVVKLHFEPVILPSHSRSSKAQLTWVNPGTTVTISNITITSGLIYTSDGEPISYEASAINTRLPVSFGPPASMRYWPQYAEISSEQRGAYLQWLATDRQDRNPESREFGYLFLFFYGLERRLLVDGDKNDAIINEIFKIFNRYASYGRSKSLPSYFCQLLHFWGAKQGDEFYRKFWPRILKEPESIIGEDDLALILSNLFNRQEPMTAEFARLIASRHDEAKRSTIVNRVPEEFMELFSSRYRDKYPEGLLLRKAEYDSRINYHAASPTLLSYHNPEHQSANLSITVPNIRGISSQFKPLVDIWNSCIEDLNTYSRVKAKATTETISIKALAALPEELKSRMAHPLVEKWNALIAERFEEGNWVRLNIEEVASLFALPAEGDLTPSQSRDLATGIESLGFAVEPDARYQKTAYKNHQVIATFPLAGVTVEPSPEYFAAQGLLQLCTLIAAADGSVDAKELAFFRSVIRESVHLNSTEENRLKVAEALLLEKPSSVSGSLNRISKTVSTDKRELIAGILVRIACIDGIVTKDERRALGKVFKAFELSRDLLDKMINNTMGGFEEVVIAEGAPTRTGEKIPTPLKDGEAATVFRLDQDRISIISSETKEVISTLAAVMAENEAVVSVEPQVVVLQQKTTIKTEDSTVVVPAWLNKLDPEFHAIMLKLIEREKWPRQEFEELCELFKMMPLGVIDSINEWSDEELGDFLLEGEEIITVNIGLIPEEGRVK